MQALPLSANNVATITKQFELWSPQDIIAWAHGTFGDDLVVTSSFGDPVLAHMTWSTVKGSTVTLIDTQYLFAQTLWYAKVLAEQTAGNLQVLAPAVSVLPDDLWQRDTNACCAIRKVAPLEHALANKSAWITGLRRDDSVSRAKNPVISHDMLRDVIKINPLANFNKSDYDAYLAVHGLNEHPLTGQGYASIGCWPCTRPATVDGDARSGRWAGTEKTECGLHAKESV